MNYVKWDNRSGVVDAETGEQVLQLLKNYCSEKFRRMAGKNLVNVLNNIKRGEDAAKAHTPSTTEQARSVSASPGSAVSASESEGR